MRGEHSPFFTAPGSKRGSSPHARGAQLPGENEYLQDGIIPACAGSTRRCCNRRYGIGDHPRMRGEHRGISTVRRARTGSSPHARGARSHSPMLVLRSRIIPACAGSTVMPISLAI